MRWRQIRAVLDDALDLPVETRAAFVKERTDGDTELRREVESLLDYVDGDGVPGAPLPVQRPDASIVVPTEEPEAVARDVDGVDVLQVPPYTVLDVTTRRSRYRIVVVSPLTAEVTIEGGTRFSHPTHATLIDGETIEKGQSIAFHVDGRRVTTSAVERIAVNPSRS